MIYLLILVALALAAPFVWEVFRPPMDADARKSAPGAFVRLPRGVTHYRWRGPETGAVVVCVHGLTTPSPVWDGIAEGLAADGYRVLTYDLFGRGYSDRPAGRQDVDFFVDQLEALLEALEVEGAVTLFGYSMGGVIATGYAARHPGRVKRLLLLAPAGIEHAPDRLTWLAARLPVLGDWLMLALYPRMARAAAPDTPIGEVQRNELRYRGYMPAVLSSLRAALHHWQDVEHHALGRTDLPVLAIWGAEDATIPISAMGKLTQWNRKARHATIPGADHALAVTHTDEVLAAVREELDRGPPGSLASGGAGRVR